MRRFSVEILVLAMRHIVYKKRRKCNAFCKSISVLKRVTIANLMLAVSRCSEFAEEAGISADVMKNSSAAHRVLE